MPRPVRAKFQPSNASPLPPAELRWKMLRYGYFDRLSYLYQTLENAVSATPFTFGNEINYPQIFHGVTVRFTCASRRMKEEIVFSKTARDSLRHSSLYGLSPSNTYLMFAAEIDLWPANIKAMAQTQSTLKTRAKIGISLLSGLISPAWDMRCAFPMFLPNFSPAKRMI